MWKCENARMRECENARMQECEDVEMRECRNARMQECRNARMRECVNRGGIHAFTHSRIQKLNPTEAWRVRFRSSSSREMKFLLESRAFLEISRLVLVRSLRP